MDSTNRKMRIGILGSTGSIGQQTLDIVRKNPQAYEIAFLTANSSASQLSQQANEFNVQRIALAEVAQAEQLTFPENSTQVFAGAEGICELIRNSDVDAIVVGIIGFAALAPVLEAIKKGIHIALANKEVLVAASSVVRNALVDSTTVLVPVDSEHSSIFQCMMGRDRSDISKVVLTASGGPFLDTPADKLSSVTPEQACAHPNWEMGKKISIDSATLMNKGLEVIEAAALFELQADSIGVLIHPQSIVHGFVEYLEGTSIAALYRPDMRIPIAFALDYIAQVALGASHVSQTGSEALDLASCRSLTFSEPDVERFPCLSLAYQALRAGGTSPTVLNAANEVAVDAFCQGQVGFNQIPVVVSETLDKVVQQAAETIDEIIFADSRSREVASKIASDISH